MEEVVSKITFEDVYELYLQNTPFVEVYYKKNIIRYYITLPSMCQYNTEVIIIFFYFNNLFLVRI